MVLENPPLQVNFQNPRFTALYDDGSYCLCFSVNLAVALKKSEPEKEIGLLDADVFGPSVPLMMNLHDTPLLTDGISSIFNTPNSSFLAPLHF